MCSMKEHTITVDEAQRQMMLMALAHLSVERPGWDSALAEIAGKMDNAGQEGPEMYEQFKRFRRFGVKAS